MAWFDTGKLVTKKSSCKLNYHHAKRYTIMKVISFYIIELKLFPEVQVYLVFYKNLLKSTTADLPNLSYVQLFGYFIKIDGEIEYKILVIVDSPLFKRVQKL